jgi:urease accessory protein
VTTCTASGTAHLKFTRVASHTVLERSFATSPVKLFTTRSVAGACWVYSATLGGGFVGGDDVRMTVDVAAGASALLMTQASTKVYRSLRPCRQLITATVAEGALFASLPDPVVCFAGADFSQDQHYDLAPGADLVLVDWITSGRHAAGERWAFAHYSSRIRIDRGGYRRLFDSVTLQDESQTVAERMGRVDVCATCVIMGPRLAAAASEIVALVSKIPIARRWDTIESATLFDGGVLLRVAGTNVERVGALLRARLKFLPPYLGDDPWARKW